MAGPLPSAPLNKLAMLTDYIAPEQRHVACPNQDVVYGAGFLALDISPVVIQVPDFGDRFWVYQIVDMRTDSFATLGKMYGTTPGFYMLVGPDWQGEVPKGITQVFRASTNSAFVGPRVFMDDTAEDRQAIQPVLRQVMMYPLSEYDGTMKSKDWSAIPKSPADVGGGERKRNGSLRRNSSTSCRRFSPTRRRCPARRRATPRCWPCSRLRSTIRS